MSTLTQTNVPLLSILIFLPFVIGLIVLALPREGEKAIKSVAFLGTLATLAVSIVVWLQYHPFSTVTGPDAPFQFVEKWSWLPALHINFFLGLDGISLLMVLMTTGIFPFVVGVSLNTITDRVRQYYFWVLLMESAVLGVFLSLNVILFYVFWEAMLIPAYFIIGIWGGPKRIQATIKFFLYTMVGSMVMLVSILALYFVTGAKTFDLTDLIRLAPAALSGHLGLEIFLFTGFFLAFGIKAPVWPFHTWVPDAYAEAPTGGTIILVALKMGLYGFIRFCIPLFPNAVDVLAPIIVILSVVGVIYAAFIAAMQTDLKRLIAYSSISHVGVIMLAIFGLSAIGLNGAVLQMVTHTITTGALFIIIGALYARRKSYNIADYGGLMSVIPTFTFVFLIVTLSAVALPLTAGFSGEILMLIGSFNHFKVATGFAATAAIWSVVYMLWMFQRVMHGPVDKPENKNLPDLSAGEKWSLYPLVGLIFLLGIFPNLALSRIDPSVDSILQQYKSGLYLPVEVGAEQKVPAPSNVTVRTASKAAQPLLIALLQPGTAISLKGDRE